MARRIKATLEVKLSEEVETIVQSKQHSPLLSNTLQEDASKTFQTHNAQNVPWKTQEDPAVNCDTRTLEISVLVLGDAAMEMQDFSPTRPFSPPSTLKEEKYENMCEKLGDCEMSAASRKEIVAGETQHSWFTQLRTAPGA